MQTEIIEAHSDEQIVEAVRGGNAERYRELVERYERLVYAVAWSRLGNPDLAEEAAQEAFIRGYRNLGLLSQAGKFGPWISSITRRVAINLGFRNRRELNKRERWALEQAPAPPELSGDEPELCTPETLRQALAELPHAHRECLVLFYLEGKSGAEAAAILDISEAAFRVRLHRARGALREQLEGKLESSLEKLRPAKSIVPVVMAAVMLSSSAKAATGGTIGVGVGAKLLSAAGKSSMLGWLVPLVSMIGALPGVALGWWWGRMERRNFSEPDGFRARLHRSFLRSFLWGFPLLVVLMLALNHSALAAWGIQGMFVFTAGFTALLALIPLRTLAIHRNPFQLGMCAYCAVIAVGFTALALGWIPPALSQLPMLVSTLLFILVLKHRPARMDYSLFLRAAQDMLKVAGAVERFPAAKRLNRHALLAFARFLGSRWLASDFRWETSGLTLRLPPVRNRFLSNMTSAFLPIGRHCSFITLGHDGTVVAHCGDLDASDLRELKPGRSGDPGKLEELVTAGVAQAWREHNNGNDAAAERVLGELPEKEVFVVAPARAPSTRWMRWVLLLAVTLMAAAMVMSWWGNRTSMVNGRLYRPVAVSEAEIRARLEQLAFSADSRQTVSVPQMRVVLPDASLFFPEAWQKVRADLLKTFWSDSTAEADPARRAGRLLGTPALVGAIVNGWLTIEDFGWTRAGFREALRQCPPETFARHFELIEVPIAAQGGGTDDYTVLDTRSVAMRLLFLESVGCADLIDGRAMVGTLLQHQVLSNQLPAGRRPNLDPALLHGTFLTFGFDPVQETWQALVILKTFDALDRIDRDACVEGILRFYHGKGLFGSKRSGDKFVIFGDARDTLAAFESLRMLNALDRVKDLEEWKFRPMVASKAAPGSALRIVTWEEMEAWVCQQRFDRMLRERKESPQAPVRSLLEL